MIAGLNNMENNWLHSKQRSKGQIAGWECSSVVEYLPNMLKVLG
jgi:hypothetical protein